MGQTSRFSDLPHMRRRAPACKATNGPFRFAELHSARRACEISILPDLFMNSSTRTIYIYKREKRGLDEV
jgi:hypothetical protein